MEDKNSLYKYPMALTQQFKHCGNPFRIDMYKGCNFGCKYCFANNRGGGIKRDSQIADFSIVEKNFDKAFNQTDKEYKNITIEMLRHRVPLHLGGMADPFQSREKKYKLTYKLLELTNRYNYPVIMSTKTAHLDDEYFNVLNPEIHAFQISLMSMNEDYIRNCETNTPTPQERLEFIKLLKSKGFWVSIRIQPMTSLDEAKEVVKQCSGIVDYITVEHIKIGNDNSNKKDIFKMFNLNPDDFFSSGREYEIKTEIKRKNIEELKALSSCPIGCGDNDLHELSDSNNCCGIDTINENFNNWIKYNAMYIRQTGDKTQWYPKNNCSSCINCEGRKSGYFFKDYVDEYIEAPQKYGKCKVKLD